MAVGSYTDSAGTAQPLTEFWNGQTWSIVSAPLPAGATGAALRGVSCWAANACMAVGYSIVYDIDDYGYINVTLAELWNGSAWSPQSTPNGVPDSNSYLTGVSCPSPGGCVAVGNFDIAPPFVPAHSRLMSEEWNGGGEWTIDTNLPDPTFAENFFNAVSCTSTSACMAVGDWENLFPATHTLLAQTWDGTTWTAQAPVNPITPGAGDSVFDGVSCTSAGCVAVGHYDPPFFEALAERWHATSWTVKNLPRSNGPLSAVS